MFFTVNRVDADGTIALGPSEMVPPQFQERLASSIAEGLYLLVTNDSKPGANARVLRVQVTDIGGSVFTLKAGPRAAARVRVNDSARLVRPFPATTAGPRRAAGRDPASRPGPSTLGWTMPAKPRLARNRSTTSSISAWRCTTSPRPTASFPRCDLRSRWQALALLRVLLLPFLEQMALYNAYDFSQSWDSPKNKPLIDKMPSVYRDPIYGDARESYTNYAAFVGPNAIFRPARSDSRRTPRTFRWARGALAFKTSPTVPRTR